MSGDGFKTLTSRTMVLPQDNIDTDQIIPARFLTTTSRRGLGNAVFYDWRFTSPGIPREGAPFPASGASDRQILVAGRNFGCGSSREHAPWALLDYGFRAIISSDIADIFTSNALNNGLLPIEVPDHIHAYLMSNGGVEIAIDLDAQQIVLPDKTSVSFTTEPFARRCLINGVDPLGHLLNHRPAIEAFERNGA